MMIYGLSSLFAQQVGQGVWSPTVEEASRLREYLMRGGFLVIDDFHGTYQWSVVVAALQKYCPGYPIVDLTPDDGIFHALYDLDQLTQIPGKDTFIIAAPARLAWKDRKNGQVSMMMRAG